MGLHEPVLYRKDFKFADRHICTSSAKPDQTAPIRLYTICHSVYSFWMHYSMVKPPCSKFRVITAILSGVQIFRIYTVCHIP